jgi:hypothetical protein
MLIGKKEITNKVKRKKEKKREAKKGRGNVEELCGNPSLQISEWLESAFNWDQKAIMQ